MITILRYVGIIIGIIILISYVLCLCIPKARHRYFSAFKRSPYQNSFFRDTFIQPFKTPRDWKAIAFSPFSLIIYILGVLLLFIVAITIIPTYSLIQSFGKEEAETFNTPHRLPEEPRFIFKNKTIRYTVPVEELTFDPSSQEIIYYNPSNDTRYDDIIINRLEDIKGVFSSRNIRFIYLPDYNQNTDKYSLKQQLDYACPGYDAEKAIDSAILSYSDIAAAYHIPDTVKVPCIIRCMSHDHDRTFRDWVGKFDPSRISFDYTSLHFSIHLLESTDEESFFSEIKAYINNLYYGPMYSLTREKDESTIHHKVEPPKEADELFDEEVYRIGMEINERIEKLRARGLSSLAISKLIGQNSNKPGKLLIDRNYRLILTDFGNKEIKLSPIHKAVFLLFLCHPEGIYFKDLATFKDELGSIYKEITGREDMAAVEDSINKLTDPFDNSINEKCARIKNAFVSEFREEVAQWYFIDGIKGERKSIKLPRELVIWEIKD